MPIQTLDGRTASYSIGAGTTSQAFRPRGAGRDGPNPTLGLADLAVGPTINWPLWGDLAISAQD